MIEFLLDPVFQGVFWTVIGVGVKAFAPQWFPFLGAAKKLTNELIKLHDQSPEQNKTVIQRAAQNDMQLAVKTLNKKLN